MRFVFFLLFLICGLSGFAAQLDDVIIDQPLPTELSKTDKEVLLFYLDHLGPDSPQHFYRIAGFYIQTGELPQAVQFLQKARSVDPRSVPVLTQLGFVYLWMDDFKEAYRCFLDAWEIAPCDPKVAMGLIRFSLLANNRHADAVVEKVEGCDFHRDPDFFLCLGILNTRIERWEEAEWDFKRCLELSPHYKDAVFQLANLYGLQKKYKEAEELYNRYPNAPEASLGLGRIAERKGEYSLAASFYLQVLDKEPDNLEARKGYAQVLAAQLQYSKAKQQYAILLDDRSVQRGKFSTIYPRKDESNWIQFMDVKSHTNAALLEEIDYTDAKEDDITLRVPVVKDYYFTSKVTLSAPILDRWRLDAQQLYYHQRENDIYVPSVNYSAFVNGGSLISHYFFAKDWKWDVVLKGVRATGIQHANYPFQNSSLFEPGTRLMYNGDTNMLVIDGHVEDQIIKNFSSNISQLLRIDVYQGGYGYHPFALLHPNFEFWAGQNYYHDSIHNWKQHQKIRAEIDLAPKYLRLSYLFEHGKFRRLTANYFSYKKQIQHTLTLRYLQEFDQKVEFELLWDHIWQSNRQVILPIGNFIFIGSKLYLIGNRYTALVRYRFQDHLRFEMSGNYMTITIPYHSWNLKGSLYWQF